MRTIKFRGKRVDNGEWVEGFLIGLYNPQIKENVIKQSFIHNGTIFYNPDKVTPETVGQFTGLTDKNGKEIYEGDILKFEAESPYPFAIMNNGVVKYEPCKFYLDDGVNQIGIHVDNWYELEVIGNIHDNPELLGGSK